LGKGDFAPQPLEHGRLWFLIRKALTLTIRTTGRLAGLLVATPNEFLLRQQASEFIPDLACQLFQVHQPASGR
jgi:hypothetical protein